MFPNNQRDHNDDTNGGAIGCLILILFGLGCFGGLAFLIKCFIETLTGRA